MKTRSGGPLIVCSACAHEMHPDLKSNRPWKCGNCGKRHANLKVHWRLLATLAGGVPLLVSAIGVVWAFFLPLAGADSAPTADWLKMGAAWFTSAPDVFHVAALFVALNALPLLILTSAYVIPRPWTDHFLKNLVLAWLVLVLVCLTYRAWELRSIGYFCMTGCWPAVILSYFVWLSGTTRRIVRRPGGGWTIAGPRRRVRRPRSAKPSTAPSPDTRRPRAAVERKIAGFRARVRLLVGLYGLSWVTGAVVTAAIVFGLTDYVTRAHDPGLRVISSLAVLAVFGWGCYRYLYLGLTTRLGDVELARRLQRRFPALGDSLSSAVEFVRQSEDDPTAGSAALRRAVIARTTAEVQQLDFRRAVEPAPTIRAALSALVICLAARSLVVLDPLSSAIAAARLVNPLSRVTWPQTYHLALLEQVTRVAKGQVFEVEAVDERGLKLPSDVRVYYRFENPDGTITEETELMRFVDGTVAARRENGTSSSTKTNRRFS